MLAKICLLLFCGFATLTSMTAGFTSQEVKCHVCKVTVQEMENAIANEDPNKTADVRGFRLDASGNSVSKTVKLIKSEMYLTELMEKICDKMDDYVKATYKKNGKFTVMKMMTAEGGMNPEVSNVDFVQDGDLNKSLEHFCLEILEDNEEAFIKGFQEDPLSNDLDIKLCSEEGKYCTDAPVQEDYEFDREEL